MKNITTITITTITPILTLYYIPMYVITIMPAEVRSVYIKGGYDAK